MNGTVTLGPYTYEAGDVAHLMEGVQRYGLDGTHELVGDPTKPQLMFNAFTSQPDHQFRFIAVFSFDPTRDPDDGAPYGFRLDTGAVQTDPPLSHEGARVVEDIHGLVEAIQGGEDRFGATQMAERRAGRVIGLLPKRGELP